MRLTVSQPSLASAVAFVSKCLREDRQTLGQMSMMAGMKISADDGIVELMAADDSSSARCVICANVEEPGDTVVSGKTLANIVKAIPDAPVTITDDGTLAHVSCQRAKYRLNTLDASMFPEFPEVDAIQSVELPMDLMLSMADKVRSAVGKDNSRPYLTGVLVSVKDGTLRTMASDSYQFAICETDVDSDAEFEAIVPGAAIGHIISTQSHAGSLTMSSSENQVLMVMGDASYATRRIEGRFPLPEKVFPREFSTTVTLDSDEVRLALRRVGVVAQKNPMISVEARDDMVTLLASSPMEGESTEVVPADLDGEPIRIGMNHRFLTDAALSMDGEFSMRMNGPMQPIVLSNYGDVRVSWLIMPVRLLK